MILNKAATEGIGSNIDGDGNCRVTDEKNQKTFEDPMNVNQPVRRQSFSGCQFASFAHQVLIGCFWILIEKNLANQQYLIVKNYKNVS